MKVQLSKTSADELSQRMRNDGIDFQLRIVTRTNLVIVAKKEDIETYLDEGRLSAHVSQELTVTYNSWVARYGEIDTDE